MQTEREQLHRTLIGNTPLPRDRVTRPYISSGGCHSISPSHPEVFANLESVEARKTALLERVRVKVRERFRIEMEDSNAVRYIPLPQELRGSA